MEETYKFLYNGNVHNLPNFEKEKLYVANYDDKDELESLDFFEDDEVERFIKEGLIYILRINGEYVACGTFLYPHWRKDIPDDEKNLYKDIGMHVSEKYRGKGYGRSMVQNLTSLAIEKDFIPITECVIENKASKATLESAGYILSQQ